MMFNKIKCVRCGVTFKPTSSPRCTCRNCMMFQYSDKTTNELFKETLEIRTCIRCGRKFLYDPESSQAKCNFCGMVQYTTEEKNAELQKRLIHISCLNCGRDYVTDSDIAKTACRFCGMLQYTAKVDENTKQKLLQSYHSGVRASVYEEKDAKKMDGN